ncbi:hypothetical protein ACFLWB_00845 [Chloroflexota bacterium]
MTVTMVAAASGATGFMVYFGIAGVLTLITSLVIKELVSAGSSRGQSLGRNLDVVTIPLLFTFAFVAFMKVWEVLSWPRSNP